LKIFADGQENNETVILFGNDYEWSVNVVQKYLNNSNTAAHVLPVMSNFTPVVDFAFVRQNCDTILLSASISTFGWWAAYLAGPAKKIYYNAVFSKPNGVENEVNAADFFLPSWISLNIKYKMWSW
uniref:L-Fucosyltransferase n=1 Tax=Toxocara canis TaxID=6265 RepID=A0A183U436_TOXCA